MNFAVLKAILLVVCVHQSTSLKLGNVGEQLIDVIDTKGKPTLVTDVECEDDVVKVNNDVVDTCPNGDYEGLLMYRGAAGVHYYQSCKELVDSVPSMCYNNDIHKTCCESCSKVNKVEDHCADGDHKHIFDYDSADFRCTQLVQFNSKVCLVERFANLCCKSCGSITAKPTEINVIELHHEV